MQLRSQKLEEFATVRSWRLRLLSFTTLGYQASNRFWEPCARCRFFAQANTFVNTCRLLRTYPSSVSAAAIGRGPICGRYCTMPDQARLRSHQVSCRALRGRGYFGAMIYDPCTPANIDDSFVHTFLSSSSCKAWSIRVLTGEIPYEPPGRRPSNSRLGQQ
jgi:hypothetical protein